MIHEKVAGFLLEEISRMERIRDATSRDNRNALRRTKEAITGLRKALQRGAVCGNTHAENAVKLKLIGIGKMREHAEFAELLRSALKNE